MNFNRRDVIKAGGVAAAATMVSGVAGAAGAAARSFDINASFANFLKDFGATPADAGGKVTFTGQDPIIRSHFRVGAAMALPAMGSAVGAAAIWRERTGQAQDLTVDLRESVYNVNPLIAAILLMAQREGTIPAADAIPRDFIKPTNNGLLLQAPVGFGNPMTFVPFETKDGRFFNITGAYPHLNERALRTIKSPPGRDNIVKAIKGINGFELEEALAANGGVGVVHRTTEEWLAHPEGKALAAVPLVEIIKIADGPPVPWTADPTQPLSGLKVISNTHVIAGTCSARTLAEYGAEVLHIARDQAFEHEALVIDVNVGMRSTFVDLRDPAQNKRLKGLVPQADVFVENFRVGTLDRLGFGPEELASGHKGMIYLSCNANSWDGPWAKRGGFDMEGLSCSGFTIGEGGGTGVPRFPPTLVMNDYIAGYLGACGTIAALRRRAKEGGSYHVRVSLTRAAMWYASLGRFPDVNFDLSGPDNRLIAPELLVAATPYGELRRLGPQVKLSKTPGKWRTPLVAVRGADTVNWA
ncbi:CoA transferase [Polymorphobacter fuscus]|uniref:Carnitine dehydratase n=1 Tax=Sandarakinorhabdus fusca TaxID=1439888 RepID=A0A7C9LFE3_9SPHN|nr:CoA transferase [Polymorphobacter fuscus]KAB7647403.1 carnitine dehydratase [Polymorphobacter fuscus]MQT16647.1 carnitine dehydratase [Polymorphobacter fuscus]NJC09368.1 crotonobetainyl-CoA:carnitine CoA-transferase CaiB-like acyl-CoA transferase [Polymorphobacter fuscus]